MLSPRASCCHKGKDESYYLLHDNDVLGLIRSKNTTFFRFIQKNRPLRAIFLYKV